MKKTSIFLLAALALAGCAKNEHLGGEAPTLASGNGEISFSFQKSALTRADQSHTASAASLSNQFIVWGEKNTAPETKAAGNPVFNNYVVAYSTSTAGSTESNTADWDYVGKQIAAYNGATKAESKVWPNINDGAQTVKYWDYSADNYTFTAISALQTEIEAGKITIVKNTEATGADDTADDKGYTITIGAGATLANLYLSDRKPVAKTAFGNQVNLKFRNVLTQVRVGFYETIPGYSVKIDKMYGNGTTESATNFVADFTNTKSGACTMTVTYYPAGEAMEYQPKIATNATSAATLELGTNVIDATSLGETAASATFDYSTKVFTAVFPNPATTQAMTIKLDYTLTSLDNSNEVIKVKGATAVVPAEYMKWKANYAYTYLFKISNNTNGTTGDPTDPSDPAGLYPITFDAVVVATEDGNQETITTVATPSITTYAAGSDVVNNNEYLASEAIVLTAVANGTTLNSTNWAYQVSDVAITESDAALLPAATGWTALGTTNPYTVAASTFTAGKYIVVRLNYDTDKYAFKVIKIKA